MNLAKRIRDYRYAKGWGPDELAGRARISRTALYQIECGKTETPRAATLRRIAAALGVPMDCLLGTSGLGLVEEAGESTADGFLMHAEVAEFAPRGPHFVGGFATGHGPRDRDVELARKFQALLDSPLGEAVARIVEESFRLLPSVNVHATARS